MCKAMEDMIAEARAEGRAEGVKESAIDIARRMLKDGELSYEEIAYYLELSVDEIKELAAKEAM